MGDRVSISFRKGNKESVPLFSHWGGWEFAQQALAYAKDLSGERDGSYNPLDRLEPDTVIVDFIRHITKNMVRVESNLYVPPSSNQGDNSDNGHWVIDLDNLILIH